MDVAITALVLQVLVRLEEQLFTQVRDLVRLESTCRSAGPAGGVFVRLAKRWSGQPGSLRRRIDYAGDGPRLVAKSHLHDEILFREFMRIIQREGGTVVAGSFAASLNGVAQARLAWRPRDVDVFTMSDYKFAHVIKTYKDFLIERRGLAWVTRPAEAYYQFIRGTPISPEEFAHEADRWARRYRARQLVSDDAELAIVQQLCTSSTAIPHPAQPRGYSVVRSITIVPIPGKRVDTEHGRVNVASTFPALNVILVKPVTRQAVSQERLAKLVCSGFDLSPCSVSAVIDNDYAYQPTYHHDAEECLEHGVLRVRGPALDNITRDSVDPFMQRVLKYLRRGFRIY